MANRASGCRQARWLWGGSRSLDLLAEGALIRGAGTDGQAAEFRLPDRILSLKRAMSIHERDVSSVTDRLGPVHVAKTTVIGVFDMNGNASAAPWQISKGGSAGGRGFGTGLG